MDKPAGTHGWRFFRAGGFEQVRIDSGADIAALGQLDQKLWCALACPVTGLEFDRRTLALMDNDGDGRIRAPEVVAAAEWACARLKDPASLLAGADGLPLDRIDDRSDEGRAVLASARRVLERLGLPETAAITVGQTADIVAVFNAGPFNGDGVVTAGSSTDPEIGRLIGEIAAAVGPAPDRGGQPGVSRETLDRFLAEAADFDAWMKSGGADPAVMPLGDKTAAAAAALAAVRGKVDDYFARCRLAAFDPRAVAALNREEKEYLALAARDLTITDAEIARLPLSRIEAGRPLPLSDGLNPAWAAAVAGLREAAVAPLLGRGESLSEAEWAALQAKLAPFEAWRAARKGGAVEPLGIARVREIVAGPLPAALGELITRDLAAEPEAKALVDVERLVRYHRDLYRLLVNFVSFRDFYDKGEPAIFQAGTLFIDQRSCDLCIRVEDMGRHGAMAGLSRMYLAYCDCVRRGSNEKMTIAAAFTAGDGDNLMTGRNGVFYDRAGRDWDATIVRIVENPISIRQAFWAPYKRVVRFIEEQVAKRAAAGDAAAAAKLESGVASTGQAAATGKAPEKKPAFDVGVVAALGVAVGGITAALGALLQAFFGLGIWMPLGLAALILLISGSSMALAWLKLRQRNLGPLLDASGWAVNSLARVNIPFGTSLTGLARLPAGAKLDLVDPYAEKKSRWGLWLALLIVVGLAAGWYLGRLDGYLPQPARSVSVLGENAPAWQPPVPAPEPKAE